MITLTTCVEGKEFHIYLADDARPFCVSTPRSIPDAYHDKLKTELDLLQSQDIITPVTKATDWLVRSLAN